MTGKNPQDGGKSPVSVNVEWTPGETGIPIKNDSKPFWFSIDKIKKRRDEKFQKLIDAAREMDWELVHDYTDIVDGGYAGTFAGEAIQTGGAPNGTLEPKEVNQRLVGSPLNMESNGLAILDAQGDRNNKVSPEELMAHMHEVRASSPKYAYKEASKASAHSPKNGVATKGEVTSARPK